MAIANLFDLTKRMAHVVSMGRFYRLSPALF
jgi:hypothetical protein